MVYIKNTRTISTLLLLTVLAAAIIGCQDLGKKPGNGSGTGVLVAPILTLGPGGSRVRCEWTPSNPFADTYDIYYRRGAFDKVEDITKTGTKLENKTSPFTVTNLANGERYSFVIAANKADYETVYSVIKTGRPVSSAQSEGGDNGDNGGNNWNEGDVAPELVLISADSRFICEWASSYPAADSYDIYYRQGEYDVAQDIKDGGFKIENQTSPFNIVSLANGDIYSIVITANVPGGFMDSEIRIGKPGSVVRGKSTKRGVSYNFNTSGDGRPGASREDMDLLGPAISWFYDWGHKPQTKTIETAAAAWNVEYMPMAWSDINPAELESYIKDHPKCRYLLGYNEPNLVSGWESAYKLPQQAASIWPKFMKEAEAHKLKVVAPAMALVGDPPIEWLDAFFNQPQVSLEDDIAAIAIHAYLCGPQAFRDFINNSKKYGKPVWMTEWCAWDGGAWSYMYPGAPERTGETFYNAPIPENAEAFQIFYLSQTAMYMEQDPDLERYAWFIPKRSGEDYTQYPWMDLLTWGSEPELTEIGLVFVHMSTCDKSIWVFPGQLIEAKDFSANNLAEWTIHKNDGWQNSVTFRVSTDPEPLSILDVCYQDINGYMWVEYQVYLEQEKNYSLTLRYNAPHESPMTVYVDGKKVSDVSLGGGSWQTRNDIALGNISPGRHTIRLRITGDSNTFTPTDTESLWCSLNWLKVD